MDTDERKPLSEARAAELFALAERVVSWEDDARRSELLHYSALYAQAAEQARRELEALSLATHVRPDALPQLSLASSSDLRSQLLTQRAQTSALIAKLERAQSARIGRPRYVYPALALALLALCLLGAYAARDPVIELLDLGNVSSKKPWRCSSGASSAMPLHGTLDKPLGAYFFYTASELEPWLEIDLLHQTRIRSVLVRNRDDCCEERAVPLVLETSTDRKHWRQLAEQSAPFHAWQPRFPGVDARWVRLRVRATSELHLHSVIVRSL